MGERPNYKRRTKAQLIADGRGQRQYGDGSLFQTTIHGKTVWRASRVVKDNLGNRRKITGSGETAALALERLTINHAAYLATNGAGLGKSIPKPRKSKQSETEPTFAAVAQEWLTWRRTYELPSQNKKPLSIQAANQYRLIIENHLAAWGEKPISTYTKDEIKHFCYWTLQEKEFSNSHQRAIQGVIFQVFAFAHDKGYIKKDPTSKLKMVSRDKQQRFAKVKEENLSKLGYVPDRILAYLEPGKTERDFTDANGTLDKDRYNAYLRLSTYEARWALGALLALRPAEVLGLTWDKITYLNTDGKDEKRIPQIAITQQLARDPNREGQGTKLYIKPNPKTAAGERTLPLSPELQEILKRWKKIQNEWKKQPDWAPYEHLANFVFTTKTGKPIRQQEDSAAWRDLLNEVFRGSGKENTAIRSLRLYSLRHLAITRMLRAGGHLAVVSEIAGHSSVGITHEVYGHLDLSDKVKPLTDLAEKTLRERSNNLRR